MEYSRDWVSRLKKNPIVDAVVFCIVIFVIGATAYVSHDSRLRLLDQEEALRVARVAQLEALKAAQELSERRWRLFLRDNPDLVVPRRFFARETIEEIEAANEMEPPPSPNGVLRLPLEPPEGWPPMDEAPP